MKKSTGLLLFVLTIIGIVYLAAIPILVALWRSLLISGAKKSKLATEGAASEKPPSGRSFKSRRLIGSAILALPLAPLAYLVALHIGMHLVWSFGSIYELSKVIKVLPLSEVKYTEYDGSGGTREEIDAPAISIQVIRRADPESHASGKGGLPAVIISAHAIPKFIGCSWSQHKRHSVNSDGSLSDGELVESKWRRRS